MFCVTMALSQRIGRWLTTVALLVVGAAVLVLAYAFVSSSFGPTADPSRAENPAALVGETIQVEVRNGSGVTGLAAQTTHFLRRRGFDVVEVGDHSSFDQQRTVIIDRVGDPASAERVAAALGLSSEHVEQDIRPEFYLDASVIIGLDYEGLAPFQQNGAP